MKLIDVSAPLDSSTPMYPVNTPFSLEVIKGIARGVVGSDGAPARVVARKS